MFCENCGTELNNGAAFCPKCGAKTGDDSHSKEGASSASASVASNATKGVKNKTKCGKQIFISIIVIVLICAVGGGFIIWKTCFSHSNYRDVPYYRDIPWGATQAEVAKKMDGYNWKPILDGITSYETDGYLGIDLRSTETMEVYSFEDNGLIEIQIGLLNDQKVELHDAVEKKLIETYGEPIAENTWKTKNYVITLGGPGVVFGDVTVVYQPY